jgi:general L-amino acid transport system permease protein
MEVGTMSVSEANQERITQSKTVWYNDAQTRGLVFQAMLLVLVVVIGFTAYQNMIANMAARGLLFGFDYLGRGAGFEIGESLIPYTATDTYGRALLVGLINTIRVAIIGIVLSTILGVFLGIARLSKNPLLSGLVGGYIEVIRNTPLVLQLVFWYSIINAFPRPREAISPFPGFFLSNRGLKIPWIEWNDALWPVVWAFVAGIVATIIAARAYKRKQDETGKITPLWPTALGLILGLPALAAIAMGWPIVPTIPVLAGFNFEGGATLTPEFFALLLGLTLYTAAFTAEIVRAGILSVSKGQWEAGRSLGLTDGRIMRLIVLPQALRVIIPPLTSTFLNFTKNTSLATVIGYPDLVHVSNTTMNQTGRAVEAILIFASIYLTLSLLTSAFMNWYNARVALRER